MHSLSVYVLLWMFGSWAFSGDQAVMNAISTTTPAATGASPLTIFASYFTMVGIALIGILGAWAFFLGIFRLRQNGNFFGARDSNEAFFYPVRMIAALALCAPVIPAGSNGPEIMLTPGHALIVGIAKTGSEWGDEGQKYAFRTMHSYNLFNDPAFLVEPDHQKAKVMIGQMLEQAGLAAEYLVQKNPQDQLHGGGLEIGNIPTYGTPWAKALLDAQWAKSKPNATNHAGVKFTASGNATLGITQEVINANGISIPVIPPAGFAGQYNANAVANSVPTNPTVALEEETESAMCNVVLLGGAFCSDAFNNVKHANANSIREAVADLQRQTWTQMVNQALYLHVAMRDGDITEEQLNQTKQAIASAAAIQAKTFAEESANIIRNTIASEQLSTASTFYEEIQSWGWMMGGTFALRAAQDFNRANSYVEQSFLRIKPNSDLAAVTNSDSVSKVAQGIISKSGMQVTDDDWDVIDDMLKALVPSAYWDESPAKANLANMTNWGRGMAGWGLGISGGGWFLNSKLMKAVGVVMMGVGFMMGYVLPTVYAVFGILGAISWLTFVASAFFGVNLWAAAQAAPKGEEHSSQMAAKGWNVLVFIGLYPILAVGGLAAAIVITNVGIPLASMMTMGLWGMFDNGIADLNGGNNLLDGVMAVVFGTVLVVLVYAFLVWSICMTSAQLITQFPRTVLNMISFSEPGLNPYEQTGQGVMSGVTGMAKATMSPHGLIGRNTSRLMSGLMKSRSNKATGA